MSEPDPLRQAMIAVAASLPQRGGAADAMVETFPFLAEYVAAGRIGRGRPSVDHPLGRLAAAGVTSLAQDLLLAIGLVDEDPRFAAILGTGGDRAAFGPLLNLFGDDTAARAALLDLLELGL